MVEVSFLGHASIHLTDGDTQLVIDPWLTDNPVATASADDVEADIVVVTHAHGDHWGDSVPMSQRGGVLVSNPEIVKYSESRGANTKSLGIGGTYNFEGGWLKFFPAWHSSSFPDGTYGGMPMGVVVEMSGKRIYHSGDTGLFSDMEFVGELGIELAILPIGDNFTMGPDDALRSLEYVRPNRTLPIHYNTFPAIEQDGEEYVRRASELGVRGSALKVGESIVI